MVDSPRWMEPAVGPGDTQTDRHTHTHSWHSNGPCRGWWGGGGEDFGTEPPKLYCKLHLLIIYGNFLRSAVSRLMSSYDVYISRRVTILKIRHVCDSVGSARNGLNGWVS